MPAESTDRKELITSIITENIYDFIKEEDKRSMIYKVSPIGCRDFGLITKENKQWFDLDSEVREYDYYEALVRFYLHILMKATHDELGCENWDKFEPQNIVELENKRKRFLSI